MRAPYLARNRRNTSSVYSSSRGPIPHGSLRNTKSPALRPCQSGGEEKVRHGPTAIESSPGEGTMTTNEAFKRVLSTDAPDLASGSHYLRRVPRPSSQSDLRASTDCVSLSARGGGGGHIRGPQVKTRPTMQTWKKQARLLLFGFWEPLTEHNVVHCALLRDLLF
jgi:hypothetical protein